MTITRSFLLHDTLLHDTPHGTLDCERAAQSNPQEGPNTAHSYGGTCAGTWVHAARTLAGVLYVLRKPQIALAPAPGTTGD